MRLDAEPDVVAVASQPFQLSWRYGGRGWRIKPRRTTSYAAGTALPSCLTCARTSGSSRGTRRSSQRRQRPAPGSAGVTNGSGFSIRWTANLRWLAGYRHPRVRQEPVASALLAAFSEPLGLLAGARTVGDPLVVLPVLYHLLWRRELTAELRTERLSAAALVRLAPAAVRDVGWDADASAAAVAG
ncbi:TnsA-like heteromeric transposase endonuclease subunit [Streptomyces griseoluteus]|uniref:TnsA-like heteromeric transposase endonuclease subunit n=1 Tax=Streptomyces griseoluteus TaxID=29306 RepID=UPI0033265E14